jgi:predicted RNA-binding Zn-ribbon protein involved in translation (DUF1610 family)
LNIDHFRCSACGAAVGPRAVRQPLFNCPECGAGYRSNYRRAMRQSLLLTLALWFGVTLVGSLLSDAWPRVLLLSIELGLVASLFVGMGIHRLLLRVEPDR